MTKLDRLRESKLLYTSHWTGASINKWQWWIYLRSTCYHGNYDNICWSMEDDEQTEVYKKV